MVGGKNEIVSVLKGRISRISFHPLRKNNEENNDSILALAKELVMTENYDKQIQQCKPTRLNLAMRYA